MDNYFAKKKKPYERPEGWEKTIQRSYESPEKDYEGTPYSEYESQKESEQKKEILKKAKNKKFNRLVEYLMN